MYVLFHVVLLLLPSRFHPSQPLLGFITIVSAVCVQRDFLVVYFDFVVLVARRWSFLVSSPAGSPHRAPHPVLPRPTALHQNPRYVMDLVVCVCVVRTLLFKP
jgi:hypothetical protein